MSREMVICVLMRQDVERTTGRLILQEFDIQHENGPMSRRHGPGMLSLKSRAADTGKLARIEGLPGVERVVSFPSSRPLYCSDDVISHSPVIFSNGATFSRGSFAVIAGPCSVESEEQIVAAAIAVKAAGAKMLRGGVFKARTSPYSFGGLGEQGLKYMARAREVTGLPIVTEVLESSQLDVVARYADAIQIGSRNMQNFSLLFEVGAHPSGLPILLKRGLAATIKETLAAAEYVLMGRIFAGHPEAALILCERGIRTFDTALRFTLDVGAIPVLQQRCLLPVIADPSHAAGDRKLVPPLARASVAAGAEGLIVEVHPDPDQAWCDGAQSLTFDGFRDMMHTIERFVSVAPEAVC